MTITDKLLKTLDGITGTGKFSTQGDCKFFFPEILVHGEELAFPVPPSQAKYLISLAEDAPYGMGEETVLNEEVRKCWQIDAGQITFPTSGKWTKYLSSILKDVAEEMGVTGEIFIDPYKLLIYEEGGHFMPHKDTEKIPGMFGTLIIALPSKHEGGAPTVRHNNKEVKTKFDSDSKSRHFQHIAFFADCEHEVKKVTSGYRVCLAFNLAQKKTSKKVLNPDVSIYTEQLVPVLEQLKPEMNGDLKAVLLNHQYTSEQFSEKTLKNEDFTKATALMDAAKSVGYQAYLGLVTLHQSGELEDGGYSNYRSSRRGRYSDRYEDDEDDSSGGEMGEIYEESLSVQLSDEKVSVGTFHITNSALLPETNLDTGKPDQKESEGYTGNAGCTMDYWYHRAAVVIWQQKCNAVIMCKYDLRGAAEMFRNFNSLDLSDYEIEALGIEIIKNIPAKAEIGRHRWVPTRELFQGIAALKSEKMLNRCLKKYDHEVLSELDEVTWEKLFTSFSEDYFQEYFNSLPMSSIEKSSVFYTPALHALLVKNKTAGLIKVLIPYLVAHNFHATAYRYDDEYKKSDTIHLMLACSAYSADESTRAMLLESILWELGLDYIRTDLGKALLLAKHRSHLEKKTSHWQSVLTSAHGRLEEEINRPILPYPDFSCPYIKPISGGYYNQYNAEDTAKYFTELENFCLCPVEETTEIKANAEYRGALEQHIKVAKLDFDCRTIRTGSPHTLQLTKNDQSYQRALKQREEDKKLLLKLSNLR